MPAVTVKRDRFSQLFAEYYQMVYNAVYPKVGSVNDTEDICQEVFIALYNHLDEIENVRAWLYGTLKNVVLQYYRRKYSRDDKTCDLFEDITLSFVNGFRDTRILVASVLEDVLGNDEERNIMELVAFHGYSYSETAKLLGVTKRKVDYVYNSIARKILFHLKERGVSRIEDIL